MFKNIDLVDPSCINCKNTTFTPLISNDRYFMGLNSEGCNNCGLVQINPRPSDSAFEKFYKTDYRFYYQGVQKPTEEYIKNLKKSERLDYTIKNIDKTISLGKVSSILDYGCSEGAMFEALKRAGFNGALYGVEPNPEFAEYAAANNSVVVHDSIEVFLERVDLIIVNHVFEHLTNPIKFLISIKKNLNPNGFLYIDVPDVDRYTSINDFHIAHVAHYSQRTLTAVLFKSGFDLISLQPHEPPNHPKSIRVFAKVSSSVINDLCESKSNVGPELAAWKNIQSFPVVLPAIRNSMRTKRRMFKNWLKLFFKKNVN